MGLKERLLLLITPLVTLPVIMGAVILLGASRDADILYWLLRLKITILFVVLGILVITVIIIASVSKSLTLPITLLAKDANRISHGELDHKIEVVAEFSEIKELIASIEQMKHELKRRGEMINEEAALGAVGRLAAQIAHDLRSPLQAISAFVDMPDRAAGPAQGEERIAAARSIQKIKTMADELLNYMKARRIDRSRVDIGEFVNDLFRDLKAVMLADTAIEPVVDVQGHIEAEIDEDKMSRVLTNLLVNSIQAMADGTGELSLSAWSRGRDLFFEIKDSGVGIDKSDLAKLFDPSFTKGKKAGTGLGLAYSKNVVEAHGGEIKVISEVGKGATFTVILPNCASAEAKATAPAAVSDERWKTGDALEEICAAPHLSPVSRPPDIRAVGNVLIADDDAGVRMKWIKIIGSLGGTVACAATSPDELIRAGEYDYSGIDFAIVDYQYEGYEKTGFDLITHLKANGVEKIYLCTGFHDDSAVRERAAALGVAGIIAKPIDESKIGVILSASEETCGSHG